jgi:very-short-patch-repair endonuclease
MKDIMINHVRELRQNSSEAEKRIWYFLRARRLGGYKFRRQHLIHPYIVDFVCLEKKLIIELDGGQHTLQVHYDEVRTTFLQSQGYKVLRFWNNEAIKETRTVLDSIFAELKSSSASSP